MADHRIQIAPGVALPLFPMRPRMGVRLTQANALSTIAALHETHVFQPKLNGDRVLLGKQDDVLHVYNRHQKPYTFKLDLKPWASLPNGTLLDGEGKLGKFYPFETVAYAGESFCPKPVEERITHAAALCAEPGRKYIFDLAYSFPASTVVPPLVPNLLGEGLSLDWATQTFIHLGVNASPEVRAQVPYWEGVVAKKKGSRYNILGLCQDDPLWVKLKWEYAP